MNLIQHVEDSEDVVDVDVLEEEERGGVELSDSMVGSYISKFNTLAQTDDSKIKSVSGCQQSDIDVASNEDKTRLTSVEQSLGLYQRSVSKVKSFGSGMVSSYKEPLDKALVTGKELHNCPL